MIKHIVMWRLKEEAGGQTKYDNAVKFKELLEGLVGKIDELVALEVGLNMEEGDGASDMVLYSEFKSMDDLKKYSVHPEHVKVVAFGKSVVSERRVVDYEV